MLKDKKVVTQSDPGTYDYLVKMSLYSFTEEEIERLQKEHADTKADYQRLCETTIEEMWFLECDNLLKKLK